MTHTRILICQLLLVLEEVVSDLHKK